MLTVPSLFGQPEDGSTLKKYFQKKVFPRAPGIPNTDFLIPFEIDPSWCNHKRAGVAEFTQLVDEKFERSFDGKYQWSYIGMTSNKRIVIVVPLPLEIGNVVFYQHFEYGRYDAWKCHTPIDDERLRGNVAHLEIVAVMKGCMSRALLHMNDLLINRSKAIEEM